MTHPAIDAVEDAFDTTRSFLTPLDPIQWLKLALVVFVIGGPGGGLNVGGVDIPSGGSSSGTDVDVSTVPDPGVIPMTAILAVVAAVILVILALALVSAIAEFVLVASLESGTVALRRYFRAHWRRGLRLFGFRIGLQLLTLGIGGGLLAIAALPYLVADSILGSVVLVLALIPVGVLIVIVGILVRGFTRAFVVPIMILEECGVITAWRKFWPTLRTEVTEYLLYILIIIGLSIAAGILVTIGTVMLVFVLAVPAIAVVALAIGLFAVSPPVGIVAGVLGGGALLLVFLAGIAAIRVPIVTYLRYYALLVLGDTNADFDLIPEQRAAVRDG